LRQPELAQIVTHREKPLLDRDPGHSVCHSGPIAITA
jgi:hypothetical protein